MLRRSISKIVLLLPASMPRPAAIVNLERLVNLHLGGTSADDDLPDHFVEDRVPDAGPTHGMTVDIEQLRRDFYSAMGWDDDGIPGPEKLRELDLESFV